MKTIVQYTLLSPVFIVEVLLILSLLFCHGTIDSGVYCHLPMHESILSQVTAVLQSLFQILLVFVRIPHIFPLILGVGAFYLLRRAYQNFQQETLEPVLLKVFLKKPASIFLLIFLFLQVILLGAIAFAFTGIPHDYWKNKHRTQIMMEEKGVESSSRSLLTIPDGAGQVREEGLQPVPMTQIVSPQHSLPESGTSEWINAVEGRFIEHDLTNNLLVLNDVVERFREKYNKLPINSAEFTSFIPALKPWYMNETEKANGAGWIYKVLYRQRSANTFELCVASDTPLSGLGVLGTWQQADDYYCLQRKI